MVRRFPERILDYGRDHQDLHAGDVTLSSDDGTGLQVRRKIGRT